MKIHHPLIAACVLLLPISIAADSENPISPTTPIRQLMAEIVTPQSDALWAAGSKAYDEPADPSAAFDDAGWSELEESRLALADVAEALLVTGRPPDAAGAIPGNPDAELPAEQIAAQIHSKPEEWAGAVKVMADAVASMEQSIAEHDLNGLAETGNALYESCDGCHQNFWLKPK